MTESAHILVVDDDALVGNCVKRILEQDGFTVSVVASAHEALALKRSSRRFDAIITDLVMPQMTGIELIQLIRAMDADIPIIVLTGQPSLETAMSSMDHGSFRYLTKPIVHERLLQVVREATSHHRLSMLKNQALELCEEEGRLGKDLDALKRAFENALSKIHIAFQPIVTWPDQQVYGYEALARSGEPKLSNPGVLFDAAEKLGRVPELGTRIRQVIAANLVDAPPSAQIFVNLHALDLVDDQLYATDQPLSEHAQRVVLEVTERASLGEIRDLPSRTKALRELGYRIAVDDLGAGYAGLSSFSQLEPDVVKLDMSLVRDIDRSTAKSSLVRSILSVCAQELGIRVVCEGVETVGERDRLQRLGADLLQGFLFGRPGPGFRRMSIFEALRAQA